MTAGEISLYLDDMLEEFFSRFKRYMVTLRMPGVGPIPEDVVDLERREIAELITETYPSARNAMRTLLEVIQYPCPITAKGDELTPRRAGTPRAQPRVTSYARVEPKGLSRRKQNNDC